MDNFSELLKNAIAEGDDLESAMRKAAATAAKEAVESLLQTEVRTLLGYGKYDPEGRNSGDSRNGSYERTVQTSVGPITVKVPRDRNGEYEPAALPKYQRRTDLVTSVILKLYSSGMTDEEMRLAIGSIYEASYSRSAISAITDAVVADVKRFSERKLPKRLFAIFLDSTYVPIRRDSVAKEAINIALGITDDGVPLVIGYSITPEESAALAVNNGCDLNCGSAFLHLESAYERGLITEEAITAAVERLMEVRIRLGMMENHPSPYENLSYELVECDKHTEASVEVARRGIVLLKNKDKLLPLDKDKQTF